MIETITKSCSISRVSNAEAAAQTDISSSLVDLTGCDGVCFIVAFGAITTGAATSVKLQQGTLSNGTDMSDIEGSAVTVTDASDNKLVLLELRSVDERYVRCVVDRGTQDAVVDGIVALTYGAQNQPVTQPTASVAGTLFDDSPTVGVA